MPALFVPEERWGAGLLAAEPPAHGRRADRPRPRRRAATAPGASRRRTSPRAATPPTASTRSAWTRTATRRTRTARWSTTASPGCPGREPQPDPPQSAYTNGVVTPHAAFLALRYRPREAMANLRAARGDPRACSASGDSPTRSTSTRGVVSPAYLSLDQGMIMAALGNALGGDVLRDAFATPDLRRASAP